MIESLTQHEIDLQTIYRDKSMSIGLSNEKTNRVNATKFANYAYDESKNILKAILFVRSPMEARRVYNTLLTNPSLLSHLELNADHSPINNDEFIKMVLTKPCTHNRGISSALDGNHDTAWIQYAKYWMDESFAGRVTYAEGIAEKVNMLEFMSMNMGWVYCLKHLCIICDRPTAVLENGVIHNESGPAIEFSDGNKIYALYGHVVPSFVVTDPSQITPAVITEYQSKNQEIARIMVNIYGPDKYFMEMGGKILDTDILGFEGSGMRMLIEDSLGLKWLIGSDGGTGRVYHMPAAEDATSCSMAHSQMCGFNESDDCVFEC